MNNKSKRWRNYEKLLIVSVTGIKTTGVVRCDQPRVIDLAARQISRRRGFMIIVRLGQRIVRRLSLAIKAFIVFSFSFSLRILLVLANL